MTTTATASGPAARPPTAAPTGPQPGPRRVLRDPASLVLAAAQPVVFVALFRHAPGYVVWSGTPLIVLASTYLRLRLAGPQSPRRTAP